MKAAADAVRHADPNAFIIGCAKPELKRLLMFYLAVCADWSCVVDAYLEHRESPKGCDHQNCGWVASRNQGTLSHEVNMPFPKLNRVIAALLEDGWLLNVSPTGRVGFMRYELNRDLLCHANRYRDLPPRSQLRESSR